MRLLKYWHGCLQIFNPAPCSGGRRDRQADDPAVTDRRYRENDPAVRDRRYSGQVNEQD